MKKYSFLIPAKINLYLEVYPVSRYQTEGSGLSPKSHDVGNQDKIAMHQGLFHPIESVFWKMPFGDTMIIYENSALQGMRFVSSDMSLERLQEKSSIRRLYEAMKPYARNQKMCTVYILRKIPTAKGLGILSSQVAYLAKFLNIYLDCSLKKKDLEAIVGSVSTDAVSFLNPASVVLTQGIGTKVRPVENFPTHFVGCVCIPKLEMNTTIAYKELDDLWDRQGRPSCSKYKTGEEFLNVWRAGSFQDLQPQLWNQFLFLPKNYEIYEKWKTMNRNLPPEDQAVYGLSGSGSAFFFLFQNQEHRKKYFSYPEVKKFLAEVRAKTYFF